MITLLFVVVIPCIRFVFLLTCIHRAYMIGCRRPSSSSPAPMHRPIRKRKVLCSERFLGAGSGSFAISTPLAKGSPETLTASTYSNEEHVWSGSLAFWTLPRDSKTLCCLGKVLRTSTNTVTIVMTDITYPLFPILSCLGFVLSLVPLTWHLQAWNSGTCYFMLWSALACLDKFVNSIVWADNALNSAPALCEICMLYYRTWRLSQRCAYFRS